MLNGLSRFFLFFVSSPSFYVVKFATYWFLVNFWQAIAQMTAADFTSSSVMTGWVCSSEVAAYSATVCCVYNVVFWAQDKAAVKAAQLRNWLSGGSAEVALFISSSRKDPRSSLSGSYLNTDTPLVETKRKLAFLCVIATASRAQLLSFLSSSCSYWV